MSRKPLLLGAILILTTVTLAAIAALAYGWSVTQPVHPTNEETQVFVIPRGRAVRLIGKDLEDAGLIRSARAFEYAVWRLDLQGEIQAGSFELQPNMNIYEVAQALTQGTTDTWVTIKEGLRTEEIGEYLAEELTTFDTNSSAFTTECLSYEGQLYPETYLVPKTYNETQMCQLMRRQFQTIWTQLQTETPRNYEYPNDDLVTLASIVEREARTPDQMREVAGILFNRLELNMPLQVDATLQYSKGYDTSRQTWWTPPVPADKEVESPYNTYMNPGLPPGPIANPGQNALQAVLNPAETNDLFYLHAPNGEMYTAETYAGHQSNIDAYLR